MNGSAAMEGSAARQFGLFLVFWILYFLIIYFYSNMINNIMTYFFYPGKSSLISIFLKALFKFHKKISIFYIFLCYYF